MRLGSCAAHARAARSRRRANKVGSVLRAAFARSHARAAAGRPSPRNALQAPPCSRCHGAPTALRTRAGASQRRSVRIRAARQRHRRGIESALSGRARAGPPAPPPRGRRVTSAANSTTCHQLLYKHVVITGSPQTAAGYSVLRWLTCVQNTPVQWKVKEVSCSNRWHRCSSHAGKSVSETCA